MDLDPATNEIYDGILARVKEPQSELSIGELGLVKKFTYHKAEKTIVVYLDMGNPSNECAACWAVNDLVLSTIRRDLKSALEEKFPSWSIEFA